MENKKNVWNMMINFKYYYIYSGFKTIFCAGARKPRA